MTSELLSKLILNTTNLPSISSNKNDINNTNNNQNNFLPKPQLNINADKFIPFKEKQKIKNQEIFSIPISNNNPSLISPSFSHYINPQRLMPYNNMLKKNIRTFNLLQNFDKNDKEKIEMSFKEKYNLDTPTIEINFKFTCDYELIESEIKEFLELFGEINSIYYDINSNSAKINFKYYFSAMYANYYLNHLLNENKKNDNYPINKEINENKNEGTGNNKINSDEKQNEDIVKFIKFLTDNYKNEQKNKNEYETKSNEEKGKNIIPNILLNKENKNREENKNSEKRINNNTNLSMDISYLSQNKNDIYTSQKKCYSNNNSSKYLFVQQNSETPIKKTNTINNYSSNNMNNNDINNNIDSKQPGPFNAYTPSLHPFNPSFRTPLLYVPFVPKMNMGVPISIPVLFPINSFFLNKSFYLNNNINNLHKNNNCPTNIKKESIINSCLVNHSNNNPININEKINNENSQAQNDNQIKEIFDNLNNKIAIISNNSNNSTNSNEKIIKNNENHESNNNSETGSNNKILSNKSDTTIKTEEVNKSSNTKSNNNSDENKKYINLNNNGNSNTNYINGSKNNDNSSSDKNSGISLNLDFMSSSKGKALSLERLNNYLQDNKPVSNFSNPILSLNNSDKKNISSKVVENLNINNKDNNIKENNISSQNNKNGFYPMNNYFNSMFNFLFIPNFPIQPQLTKLNNMKPKPNPNDFNKNVIDFNKLTLETKNKVHFMTHSSRNYYYKYVCNYSVQIENDNIFMVTKRIIGKNGCFLKKILQESCIKYGDYSTKIRLRGKGSGYVDKISNTENEEEPLTLSVSSLNYPTYYNCCLLVDNLMNKVYDDYFEYLHKVLPKELHYSIIKKKLIKNEFIVDRVNSMPLNCGNKNILNNSINNIINEKNNNKNIEDKKEEINNCDKKNEDIRNI